ncbi:MAG: DUF1614 domain-containing protein [Gammaproteobacteria bacterium]|nr:DUF1614 domain-containing protein [Gammaproteobacteria bacterium]
MQNRYSPGRLAAVIVLLVMLVSFIQLGALTLAFYKLGLTPDSALMLLFASLLGSIINLPLLRIKAEAPKEAPQMRVFGLLRPLQPIFNGYTTIAINIGGGLLPLSFSLYLMDHSVANMAEFGLIILIISSISYLISRPVHGIGIGMPVFIAPISAALLAVIINPEQAAALAYSGGTLGVLIGADLFRLKDIRKMGTPIASIGGAGTFDGIFITGIIAVLLT